MKSYVAPIGGDIDAEYFVDYYTSIGKWPRNWRARIRNWQKNGKKNGRIKPQADAAKAKPPRVFTAADWDASLCAERCDHCRGGCVIAGANNEV